MNETTETMTSALESKIGAFLRKLLKLGDDVPLDAEADLVQQIGLDSIEAFDAVASFHELLNLPIPDDFNPRTANSIHNLSNYLMDRFGPDAAERFLDLDLDKVTLGGDQEDL